MLKRTVARGIYHMDRVAKPEAQKNQKVPQNIPDTSNILEISLALHREWQGAIPTTNMYISLFLTPM